MLAVWWARGRRALVGIVTLGRWCVLAMMMYRGFARLRRVLRQCRLVVRCGYDGRAG